MPSRFSLIRSGNPPRPPLTALLLVSAVLLLGGCGLGREEVPRFDKVLMISVDTLRADYLGTYNPLLETSPEVDRFAREGFTFIDATAPAASTLTSHTSLVYGLHTSVHRTSVTSLPSPQLTHPLDALRDAGFTTAAFVGGLQLRPHLEFDRGFDRYEVVRTTYVPGRPPKREDLKTLVDSAAEFMGEHRDRPFFLFVHNYVLHFPHYPPERFLSIYERERNELDPAALEAVDPSEPLVPPADGGHSTLADYLGNERRLKYAALVRYMDAYFGQLLDVVRELGLEDQLVVVFTADHGDSHGERGHEGHGVFYREVLRVPLILRVPGLEGSRVDAPVQLVDVMPTLFSLLGVEPPFPFSGVDLAPMLTGETDEEELLPDDRVRFAANRNTKRGEDTICVMQGPWKLIFDPEDPAGDRTELYHAGRDPGETDNLADEHPEVITTLLQEHEKMLAETEPVRRLFPRGDFELEDLDPDTLEELRALGYIR